MRMLWRFVCALVLLASAPVRADTAMTLFKSFSGNVNFAGTQVTIRDKATNASPCRVSADSVVQSASLSLPTLATVVSAHLYWAGSGSPDTTVTLNGKSVTAASNRVYTSGTIGGGFDYFSAAADVTEQVKLKGSGTYTFSGLRVSNGRPWCDRSAVLGGYALVVVYSHWNETYRALNLYEGFRAMLDSEVKLDMANFRVPDNITSSAVGRFGHLVWEGDADLKQEGESLWFNNKSLTMTTYGPSGNNFNSKSSVNSDQASLGIDFDAYSLSGWPARLNTVSALFRTGGDLVLLNAAILAVPSTPAADLAVELVRTTELRAGSPVSYTATVTNQGPGFEPGPVKLSLSLPAGLSYASASGTNWSCTGSGTTVNCTYTGTLNNGEKTVLTFRADVATGSTGNKTTTVTVAGNNDPGTSNNQDSDTASLAASGGISFEYTSRKCEAGELVGAGGTCPLFAGPVVAGATPTIWLTAVDSSNRAKSPNSTSASTVNLDLALGCVNPSAGTIGATYGGVLLPACVKDGTVAGTSSVWKSVQASFAAGQISLGVSFRYLDVGSVKLYVRTTTGAIDFTQFVSMPAALRLKVSNAQGAANPESVGLAQKGFVRAGERFTISVEALPVNATGTTDALPNFGKEEGKLRPTLKNTATRIDEPVALGAALLDGEYPASGPFTGKDFFWSDIGSFKLRVSLDDYLGEKPAAVGEQNVGRFYPAYFSTSAGPGFACLPRMRCPYIGLARVNGAIYSNQPFDVSVRAHDENGRALENFDTARYPALVPTLTLTAVDAPGTGVAFAKIAPGLADTPAKTTTRSVKFGLGAGFDASLPKTAWLGPTAVYLRATAPDNRLGAALSISSVQSEVAESEEGGIMVINGRLAITNVIGSELLKTPIPMMAQYWTGSNWENNTSFSDPTMLKADGAIFTDCQRTLSMRGAAGNMCNTQLVKSATVGSLALTTGSTKFMLAPVGAGQFGSFRIEMKTENWLPSMFGQVTIGAYKSPVIYIREMY
ncbi:DUF6701 domain-containing protein [Massilia sp. 9I]|uniref:DUF6701 domain-containing protein n=1 Tax=Massilia sp. 9I TaxID=2653152 RepID=UPI0012EF5577|nr:DUF6701 domain-containing protein [Massilia sp. 9I]VXB06895.1 conserved exported hypothetical protein [Massilia sp. 9I]